MKVFLYFEAIHFLSFDIWKSFIFTWEILLSHVMCGTLWEALSFFGNKLSAFLWILHSFASFIPFRITLNRHALIHSIKPSKKNKNNKNRQLWLFFKHKQFYYSRWWSKPWKKYKSVENKFFFWFCVTKYDQ